MRSVDVAIVGAGTSGLTARSEVAKVTNNYVVIDDGPLGTTCARVGCMPSKVLIQAANDFHRRQKLDQMGIRGGDNLTVDLPAVMEHVRSLRDRFVRAVKSPMKDWEDRLIQGRAQFVDPNTLDVGGEKIVAKKIIIATGSSPILPKAWLAYQDYLVDTNAFFELSDLPKSMAVLGLGVIGLELGQALHRLGVKVVGVTSGPRVGGLTDPVLQEYVNKKLNEEMNLHFNGAELLGVNAKGFLQVKADDKVYEVHKALIAVGRKPNLDNIGLENLGLTLDERGFPEVDINTMKLKELPHIFLPGDVNGERPILHEAADEGIIAGHNAVNEEQCFKRRVPMGITFSDPNIAYVGLRHEDLIKEQRPFVTGRVSFEGQGRSIVKLKEQGLLHIYADTETGEILGAELQAPDGEHLAHLIAWALSLKLTVEETLRLPFYHPVVEEGLRTALRDCARQVYSLGLKELFRCQDPPIR